MMKIKPMNIFWLLFTPALVYGLYVVAVLAYGTLNDYQPDEVIEIDSLNSSRETPPDVSSLSFVI